MQFRPVVTGTLLHQRIILEAKLAGAEPVHAFPDLQAIVHIALRSRRRRHAAATQRAAVELVTITAQQQVTARNGIEVRPTQRQLRLGIGEESAPLRGRTERVLPHADALRPQLRIDGETQQHLTPRCPRHIVQGLLQVQHCGTQPGQIDRFDHGPQTRDILRCRLR